jgi:hypothetical protein
MSPSGTVHSIIHRTTQCSGITADLGFYRNTRLRPHCHRDTTTVRSREKVGTTRETSHCVVSGDTQQSGLVDVTRFDGHPDVRRTGSTPGEVTRFTPDKKHRSRRAADARRQALRAQSHAGMISA